MTRILTATIATLVLFAGMANAGQQDKKTEIAIYPLLVQAPFFGASLHLPSVPGVGGGGEVDQRGSTDVSLNTLYMAGVSVRAPRWFAEVRGQWANLSASRESPLATVTTDARFALVRGGVPLGEGFSATAGVRRIWGALDATLDVPPLASTLNARVSKALYDPLIGIDWRRRSGALILEGNFLAMVFFARWGWGG
jgi:hypothetical protein